MDLDLIVVFCAFVEFAGYFATDGRINGWGDIFFIVVFALLGLIAFINSIRMITARRT